MDFGFGGGAKKLPNKPITTSKQVEQYINSMKSGKYFNNNELEFAYHNIKFNMIKTFPIPPSCETPDQDFNKVATLILNDTKQNFNEGIILHKCELLQRFVKEREEKIKQYAKEGYPKAALVWFLASKAEWMENLSSTILNNVLNRQWNPMFCAFVGKMFAINGLEKGREMLEYGIKYGESLAFQFMGEIFQREKKFKQAFTMFKNAEALGHKYGAWIHLADLYNQRSHNFTFCPYRAFDYEKKVAILLKYEKENIPSDEAYYRVMGGGAIVKTETKEEIQKELFLFEGNLIASFLDAKIYDFVEECRFNVYGHRVMVDRFRTNIRNYGLEVLSSDNESDITKNQKKVYEIALKFKHGCSGFLGVDVTTNRLEMVMIDNWKKIPLQSINQLLDEEGYLVEMKKYSVEENGFFVHTKFEDIAPYELPASCEYKINLGKIRELAKTLLTNKCQQRSLILYDYLLECGAPDRHILLSNKAFALDKLDRWQQAQKWYKKSLEVNNRYDKSYIRLGYLFAKKGNLLFALQVAKEIQDHGERMKLVAKVEEMRNKGSAQPGQQQKK